MKNKFFKKVILLVLSALMILPLFGQDVYADNWLKADPVKREWVDKSYWQPYTAYRTASYLVPYTAYRNERRAVWIPPKTQRYTVPIYKTKTVATRYIAYYKKKYKRVVGSWRIWDYGIAWYNIWYVSRPPKYQTLSYWNSGSYQYKKLRINTVYSSYIKYGLKRYTGASVDNIYRRLYYYKSYYVPIYKTRYEKVTYISGYTYTYKTIPGYWAYVTVRVPYTAYRTVSYLVPYTAWKWVVDGYWIEGLAGSVTLSKTPKYIFSAFHNRENGEVCDMRFTLNWDATKRVTKVEAYHDTIRFGNKGTIKVHASKLDFKPGKKGSYKGRLEFPKPAISDSELHIILTADDGTTAHCYCKIPVNGFYGINIAEPDLEQETKWGCSLQDEGSVMVE